MPIDYATRLYLPLYDTFARTITIVPIGSQPGMRPYNARGIYDSVAIDVVAMDGSILSDQKTVIDIREAEFEILPAQRDHVLIPGDSGLPDEGEFEVIDADSNGGGETTLTIRKLVPDRP